MLGLMSGEGKPGRTSPTMCDCSETTAASPGFAYPEQVELWLPMATFGDPGTTVRTGHNWLAVGRLRPEVPMERAQAEISAIERHIKKEHPSPFHSKDPPDAVRRRRIPAADRRNLQCFPESRRRAD